MLEGKPHALIGEQDGCGLAEVVNQLTNLLHDNRGQTFIGLIQQQQPGLDHQRTCHRQHLLLAAGESGTVLVRPLSQHLVFIEYAIHRPAGGTVLALIGGHIQVVPHRQPGEYPAIFRHITDACAGNPVRGPALDRLAIIDHLSGSRRRQPHNTFQGCALSRTVTAKDANRLTGFELKGNTLERLTLTVERLDIANIKNHGLASSTASSSSSPR